jgi:hypothetical protein
VTIWAPVVGFEGLYEVSDMGDIRSITRQVENSHTGNKIGKRIIKSRIMRPASGSNNITLRKNGKNYYFRLHQLILRAFIGPPPSVKESHGRHLDDTTSNNKLLNLAWGSPKDNYDDAVRNGKHGKGSPGALLRGEKLRGRPRSEKAKAAISATKKKHPERQYLHDSRDSTTGRFT